MTSPEKLTYQTAILGVVAAIITITAAVLGLIAALYHPVIKGLLEEVAPGVVAQEVQKSLKQNHLEIKKGQVKLNADGRWVTLPIEIKEPFPKGTTPIIIASVAGIESSGPYKFHVWPVEPHHNYFRLEVRSTTNDKGEASVPDVIRVIWWALPGKQTINN